MPLRTAVVGCGALANSAHLPNIQASPLFDLIVTCDINEGAARAAAAKWGADRVCADWREVVGAEDVDLIVLCTHLSLRSELICAALEAGKPVYTEKPMAGSKAETMTILRAADETGVPLCIGHNRRSSPAVLEFKRLFELARERGADRKPMIDRGSGKRQMIAEERQTNLLIRVNDDAWTWKLWAFADEHGIMLDEMTHFIDLALWFMPAPLVEVYACGSPRGNFVLLIRFADGSLANLHHSMVGNFDYPKERFEASARNVTISLDHHLELRQCGLDSEPQCQYFPLGQGAELTDKKGIEGFFEATNKLQECRRQGRELPVRFVSPSKGHLAHLERFARHVEGAGENPCPPVCAVVVMNVTLKCLESVRLGLPVKLGPEDYDPVRVDRRALQ